MTDTRKDLASEEMFVIPLSGKAREQGLVNMDPNLVLDKLMALRQLRNDAALSRALRVKPPTISKIRSRRQGISAAVLIRMHEVFNVPIKELRNWMGDHRPLF